MKLYFRLLSYCKPIGRRMVPYFIFISLSIIFSLFSFPLIIPLLNVLFNTVGDKEVEQMLAKPEFEFSTSYLKSLFNYYFASIIQNYGKYSALKFICITIVSSVLLANFFRFFSLREIENLKYQTKINLRKDVFSKILNLDLSYFSTENKGNLMSKCSHDIGIIQASLTSSISVFIKEPLTLIFYFGGLFIMSAKLTIFTIIFIPVSGLLISYFVKKLKKPAMEIMKASGRLTSVIEESISGIKIIKAFNGEKFINKKFNDENEFHAAVNRRINIRKSLISPFSEFSGVIVVAFILLYGGQMVINKEIEASTFIAYLALFSQVLRPAKAISSSYSEMAKGFAAGERVLEIIDIEPKIKEAKNALPIETLENNIIFNHVTFSYEQKEVLKNIHFTIPKGETVALVGPSGGGKSTIASLIARFYDPDKGTIEIDGKDIRQLKIQDLRGLMGIVTQEPILFNDTIANNIKFGDPDATQEEIKYAAKIANAHEFIMETDNGYETSVGDRGSKLSGGQRQRISIARAVLKNPPFLILDEATSSLDTESEKLVQAALDNLMQNRTSLVIAHRLSTIQNANKIIVIQNGEIIEEGTHEQLIHQNQSLYRRLNIMQST